MSTSIIAIVGPTATGKTAVAARLAEEYHSAVLSADSMQVYRDLDIGTGKVLDHRGNVRFYGIDIVDASEAYSAALFQEYGRDIMSKELRETGRIILCGGTGFYIRAVLDDMSFPPGEVTSPRRMQLEEMLEQQGAQALWNLLNSKDPESAAIIPVNNSKRVIRALELQDDGKSYAEQAEHFAAIAPYYDATYVAFSYPRDELYQAIDSRVDAMMSAGLVEEVQLLKDQGLEDALTAKQAIGYKEVLQYLNGETTRDEAVDMIKRATRRYAKRQISWFKRDPRITWIDGHLPLEEKVERIVSLAGWSLVV